MKIWNFDSINNFSDRNSPFYRKNLLIRKSDILYLRNDTEFLEYINFKNSQNLSFKDRFYLINNNNNITSELATFLLHFSIFNTNKKIIIYASNKKIYNKLFLKIKEIYEKLPYHLKIGVINYNKFKIFFDNDSMIMVSSSKNVCLGFNVDLFIILEAFTFNQILLNKNFKTSFPTILAQREAKYIITSRDNTGFFKDMWLENNNFIKL